MSGWTLAGTLFPAIPPFCVGMAATATAVLGVHPRILALSAVNWMVNGAAYWLLLRSLTTVHVTRLPMLSGVNALSFLAGWIVWIAPAGTGPRELVMKSLLLPLLPGGVAAVIAVVARLWNVAGEVLAGVIVLILRTGETPDRPPAPAVVRER